MFYQELTLLPDATININHLWSKVYTQIHLALASQMTDGAKGRIGVSFPQYETGKDRTLGSKLRLFAETEDVLDNLEIRKWMRAYREYVHIKDVHSVPADIDGYAVFRRQRQDNDATRDARRYAKRHDVSFEEAKRLYPEEMRLKEDCPFICISSKTNHNRFSLVIEKIRQDGKIVEGFGSYGLDNHSTVPEF